MKRQIPKDIYRGLPCSAVAVGCAKGTTRRSDVKALCSPELKDDGYLSLKGMNALVRANLEVTKQVKFKRGERPLLREYAKQIKGQKAVVCVLGHYVYFDGKDYWSYFWNGGDEVISAWLVG
jgi:hypothetical protein